MTRDFKGIWIPKEIWLNKDLTVMEKLFLIEIDSLDNEDGCFASNAHFSEFFDVSKGRCSQIIKSLESKKLIEITILREGKIITRRVIKILNTLVNKLNTPIKKTKYPYLENDEGINTNINNTKEREGALEFLEDNHPLQTEAFKMQYKKDIKDWNKFVLDFEDTVTMEALGFDGMKLLARLRKYARNWIMNTNSGRFQVIRNDQQSETIQKGYRNAAI